ncbi:MAG: 50S ribosomal protein L2 [Parcubacteria group bacterium]|nr:50S ribosomal protein L2 [Parcubacteria group bacterium]
MPVKIYKPTSPGRRNASVNTFAELTYSKPHKRLVAPKKNHAGRNHRGSITVRHQGSGVKKMYRMVDFLQDKWDIPAKVISIEYDPNRSAWIALLGYRDGEKRYILALQDMKVGNEILSSQKRVDIQMGNRMPMKFIPIGSLISSIEMRRGKGAEMVRSAGNSAQLMAVEDGYALIRMPSKELRKIPSDCMATIGAISNPDHGLVRYGKAGRMRYLGVRPRVRGKAMNPVDHPHGGGEGNTSIGLKAPKTKWGKKALGVKTRKNKSSDMYIVERRKK